MIIKFIVRLLFIKDSLMKTIVVKRAPRDAIWTIETINFHFLFKVIFDCQVTQTLTRSVRG